MNTPELTRIEIYRQIRIVLVRHLVDIGRLSIQISASHLHLHGSLCRLPGVTAALTPDVVQSILSELGRIKGIRRVDGEFDNWRLGDKAGASWVPVAAKKIISQGASSSSTDPYIIKDTAKHSQPPAQ
jgi:hypothetical protein